MGKKLCCCGMCIYFRMGRCKKKDNEPVDCLNLRCEDFKGYFDKGD